MVKNANLKIGRKNWQQMGESLKKGGHSVPPGLRPLMHGSLVRVPLMLRKLF